MKTISAFCAVIALAVSACDTMNRPITSGDFDPLAKPGSNSIRPSTNPGVVFAAGQFVRATIDHTAFFKTRPTGSTDADKLLTRGTSMKVISHSDNYVKVELDSGEVGFVPAVMLEDPNAAASSPVTGPGEFQVYPPLNLPPALPELPAAMPPEGSIPTVIDPDAPAATGPFAAPPASKAAHAPLPPNGKE
ncbi:MAG: hypothetical protein WCJ14_01785 [Verrucomicrobiota bacterium]